MIKKLKKTKKLWNTILIMRYPRRYIKKIFFHLFSNKCLRPLMIILTSPWFECRTFVNISNIKGQVKELFNASAEMVYISPNFFDTKAKENELISIDGPRHYGLVLENVGVIGGSNLILLNKTETLYDLKYNDKNKKFRYTDEAIRYYNDEFCIINKGKKNNNYILEKGIFMGGNYSWNYYHLLFEILAKFERIESLEIDSDIPLLIDNICKDIPQYLELFKMLDKESRQYIFLENNRSYIIKNLYYISSPNFMPPNYINDKELKAEDVLFDLKTIQYLRLNLLPFLADKKYPTRIFISRGKASRRRQFNEKDVFSVLKDKGFVIIYPEDHSISEQVTIFNKAEIIVGGSGAAFSNLLFCNKSCKVVIFSKTEIPYSGFSTIAKHIGVELIYLTEDISFVDEMKDIHESFLINSSKLESLIKRWT